MDTGSFQVKNRVISGEKQGDFGWKKGDFKHHTHLHGTYHTWVADGWWVVGGGWWVVGGS